MRRIEPVPRSNTPNPAHGVASFNIDPKVPSNSQRMTLGICYTARAEKLKFFNRLTGSQTVHLDQLIEVPSHCDDGWQPQKEKILFPR